MIVGANRWDLFPCKLSTQIHKIICPSFKDCTYRYEGLSFKSISLFKSGCAQTKTKQKNNHICLKVSQNPNTNTTVVGVTTPSSTLKNLQKSATSTRMLSKQIWQTRKETIRKHWFLTAWLEAHMTNRKEWQYGFLVTWIEARLTN